MPVVPVLLLKGKIKRRKKRKSRSSSKIKSKEKEEKQGSSSIYLLHSDQNTFFRPMMSTNSAQTQAKMGGRGA